MSRRALTGRADLLLALAHGDAVTADIAGRLGYERKVILPAPQQNAVSEPKETADVVTTDVILGPRPPVPWWRAQEFRVRKVTPLPLPPIVETETVKVTLEPFDPLASIPAFVTRLRQVADLTRPGKRIDLNRVVYELSRGRQLVEFPRLNRRSWSQDLHVVIDFARRLVPYRRDQELIRQAMKRLLPKGGGTVCILREGDAMPVIEWPEQQRGQELALHPRSMWLVLSDLGSMQQSPTRSIVVDRWMQIGKRLKRQECVALALVPCRPDSVPDRLARLWTLIPWEGESRRRPKPADATTRETSNRILALLSAAVRIEPRLLRAVRKLLVEGLRDPGLESTVWQQCEGTTHCSGAALSQKQAIEFRGALLDDELRYQAWALIEAAHRGEYIGVALLEVLRMGNDIAKVGASDRLAQARRWFQSLGTGETEYGGDFFIKAASQLTPEAWEAAPELHVLWRQFFPADDAAPGYDPALAAVDAPLQVVRVSQVGGRFEYRRRGELTERSSPLATIRLKNPEIVVDSLDAWPDENQGDTFWLDGEAPEWADRWGRDDFGPWVEFVVGEARQRMRWIPPGEFLMGSAEKPEFEFYPETPQQPVTISRGFWLFDTPCTQVMWKAVMGENLSHFNEDERPVEKASWEDCQTFNRRLGERCLGLKLTLPTEAQWEYACRAGTTSATYAGDGSLDKIAWYNDNSGSKTHPVGRLRPNGFGLYDMLGNVWEWCRDHAGRKYAQEQITDPLHETGDSSAIRVFRGGSWDDSAQNVRAAYRGGGHPRGRGIHLGFRCSSSGCEPSTGVRTRKDGEPGGRRPEVVRSQRAVRGRSRRGAGGDSEPASEDRLVRLSDRECEYARVPQGPIVRLRTDLEEILLCQALRPRWADRIGRDQFGLWAEFVVARQDADDVRQRLRWIPPGRFLMGSPESEKGRFEDEGPQHEATVAAGFWLFDTPCTQEMWKAVMGDNPSKIKGDRRPVEQVDFQQATEFAAKLSTVVGLSFRLPSETEWEYACRAGSEAATYAGDFDPENPATQDQLQQIAWYMANAGGKTHDVAELHPNAWGLYDMLGNVLEWCQDIWRVSYDQASQVDSPSASRVRRGGGLNFSARRVRAAYRLGYHPQYRGDFVGFRCSSLGGEPVTGDEGPERSGRSHRGAGGESAAESDET